MRNFVCVTLVFRETKLIIWQHNIEQEKAYLDGVVFESRMIKSWLLVNVNAINDITIFTLQQTIYRVRS